MAAFILRHLRYKRSELMSPAQGRLTATDVSLRKEKSKMHEPSAQSRKYSTATLGPSGLEARIESGTSSAKKLVRDLSHK